MTPSTPAIRLDRVAHRYGSFQALSDVTFEVGRGDVFGFIGPNGAGKTTTLRCLATLEEPDQGSLEVCGVDVRRDPKGARRLLGYMPDHAGVYERLTGGEYLEFFAGVQKLALSRVAAVVELTGLSSVIDRQVSELSKGLKQRMQLARVLLHDPEVLILDEPASDLDPRARIELRELVLELRRRGKTILLSSHILTELSDICTHVGILERGRIVAHGPIGAVAARSARGNTAAQESANVDAHAHGDGRSATPGAASVYRANADPSARAAKLRLVGEPARIQAVLAEVDGVREVVVSQLGGVSLRYSGDERTLGQAVKALVHADILVCGVEPEQNELERIFLELTRGEGT